MGSLHLAAFAISGLISAAPVDALVRLWPKNLVSHLLFAGGFAALGGLFAVFPDGQYHRRYERWAVRGFATAAAVLPVIYFLGAPVQEVVWAPLKHSPSTHGQPWVPALAPLAAFLPVIYLSPVVGLFLLLLRYSRAGSEQRVQMCWPLTSAVLLVLAMVTSGLVTQLLGLLVQAVSFLLIAGSLPATVVIGMLRHRLFDIDLIIRKSLVYGALWLAVAALYATGTAALGITAGQRLPLGTAVVLVIVAAMLFQPARTRLERLADKVVYGARLRGTSSSGGSAPP